ncbi:GntR family transcriptional regulator [Frondihabitans cladoniiphilus]|uniref:GntR family transcriptional regulator n=1 Tax=Frondihabitans cladoniiphilus TaxID=715785 RepID=A0ABP8W4V3_9MICO
MSNIPPRRLLIRIQPQRSPRRAHQLLRAGIRDGLLRRGEMLVEDSLVKALATSRNSVREALQLLASERLVTRQAHHGTKVVGRIRRVSIDKPNLHGVTRTSGPGSVSWRELERQILPAPAIVAAKLDLVPGSLVLVTEHLLVTNDEPYSLRVAYRPLAEEEIEEFRYPPESAEEEISVLYRVITRVEATLEAVGAEARTANLLGIDPGAPLLLHELVMFDSSDRARELSFNSYHGGRVAMTSTNLVTPWGL